MNMHALNRIALLTIGLAVASCNSPYENDDLVVDETYMHRYGMEVPEEHWTASGEHGQVISTLKNGVIVSKTYDAGDLHGPASYTFPHSQAIEKEEIYHRGQIEKETRNYYSGIPNQETLYSGGNKFITTWYETGSPKSKEEYHQERLVKGEYYSPEHALESKVENGAGTIMQRDSYGLLLYVDTIANGQLSMRTSYHPNGSPKEITPYVNNLPEGERKTFLPAGEPSSIELWSKGQQNGVAIIFQNGEKAAEVPYKDGLKNGVERRFRDGETLVEEITWVNGQRHGSAKTYIANTINTEWFFKDQGVSKSDFDYMSTPISN